MLFRMVPKPEEKEALEPTCFRVMLFRMVPKQPINSKRYYDSFRVMLFRMVPKPEEKEALEPTCFRVMLFRMVPKPKLVRLLKN